MEKLNIKKLTETIKSQIKSYQEDIKLENVGTVASVGDGVVLAYGLEQATLGSLVTFKSHATGLVIDLTENLVGIILLDKLNSVKEGDSVKTLSSVFEIPVGENFLGRTINPLGEPLDNGGAISYKEKRPVERKAYGVFDRGAVNEPLTTGIMTIDSLIPIGKGQRELIIGDRQTGKTTIAIDTILNQKGKNVKCIYCAIGQKDATVAGIRQLLKERGCLDYTTIVLAGASASSTQLYLAPFVAVAMAEYFMEKGEDALVVYDDLTKHAKAYREISLLLKRPPGREAYPGDIFYLHSRLLERSAKLSDKLKGGSITALPIIETQAGDISSYIPTNVISITDGQIFLEQELFYSGIRPAINSGLSVSRVGGRAQSKAIKSVAGTLRINLAAYRELEAFAQFGSDLDEASKFRLERGRKTIEILKQNIHELRDTSYQAVILYALNNGFFDNISIDKVNAYTNFISEKLRTSVIGKKIVETIVQTGSLPAEDTLKQFLEENTKFFLN